MAKKNKKQSADRDSSDPDAEEAPPVEKAKKATNVEAKPAKSGKKRKAEKDDAVEEAPAKSAKKAAKVESGDKEALKAEALKAIEAGIALPEYQDSGDKARKAFIPDGWHTKFAPVLGKYKKFVAGFPEKFALVDTDHGNFTLRKAGTVVAKVKPDWEKALTQAWAVYCTAVPKAERDVKEFIAAIPGQKKSEAKEASKSDAEAKKGTKSNKSEAKAASKSDAAEAEAPPTKPKKKKKVQS